MIIDTPDAKLAPNQPQDAEGNYPHLQLNPGAPERKPRSVGKLCLWLTILLVGVVGSTSAWFFVTNIIYHIQNPHSEMYYEPPKGGVIDYSAVVQPMIKEEDTFDIVASVWIRDDKGKDGSILIEGEEYPETLVFSDTVFRDVHAKRKSKNNHRFASVNLQIPTSYFKRANFSNYDLRASFVLVQPQRPSWIERAQMIETWKPTNFHSPKVRLLKHTPTLEDEIYDSFGITIPLLQFHELSGAKTDQQTTTHIPKADSPDDDEDYDDDELFEEDEQRRFGGRGSRVMDIFQLEFMNDKKGVSKRHPFIISRTHLGIIDETNLYKRTQYMRAQKELADLVCNSIPQPKWHQCMRYFSMNGVFETSVRIAARPDGLTSKKNKNKQHEYLYAPYLQAAGQSAGPKDLVAVPEKTSSPEYVNVTWRLSFRTHKAAAPHFSHIWTGGPPMDFNMSASDEELTYIQHKHDIAMGVAGFRIHENAHPRRNYFITFVSRVLRALCWFLTIHYWYTRTSTVGISRFGTALVAFYFLLDANQAMLTSVLDPNGKGLWLSRIPFSYVFLLVPPFFMLKAISRLEFGSSTKGKERKGTFRLGVYFAKATHSERASERIESRISKKSKFLFLISLFGIAHLFAGPYTYFVPPRVQPPPPAPHPLHALSDHVPTVLQHVYSLGLTLELGGTVLQFIMNAYSRTYAGKYKATAFLMLVADAILFLDLLPSVVGTTGRIGGVLAREGLGLVISNLDFAQALRYKSVKTSSTGGVEE